MKRPHRYILLSFLSVVVLAAGVYARCVPTYTQILLYVDNCGEDNKDRTIQKK